MLLTYTPLVLFSLALQIDQGVDAIRFVNPYWDEHRGPLYPNWWYNYFSLYDPHGESEDEVDPANKVVGNHEANYESQGQDNSNIKRDIKTD